MKWEFFVFFYYFAIIIGMVAEKIGEKIYIFFCCILAIAHYAIVNAKISLMAVINFIANAKKTKKITMRSN